MDPLSIPLSPKQKQAFLVGRLITKTKGVNVKFDLIKINLTSELECMLNLSKILLKNIKLEFILMQD